MKGNLWMEIRNERKKGLVIPKLPESIILTPELQKNMHSLTPNRYTHLQHPSLQNWILTNT